MGGRGGGGRKPRNFATFRLFPRDGAADPNDRVFVRVDNNDYTVPGFADEDPSLSDPTAETGHLHSSANGPLPEHVRREILELGLPDDGYNYLSHLRELRPSAAAASSFVPNSTARPEPLPLDVKVVLFALKPAPPFLLFGCLMFFFLGPGVRCKQGSGWSQRK
jgi:protein LTV1